MSLRRFDAWAGKTLFHPPIIAVCWALGWSQYRLYSHMLFAFGLYILWDVWDAWAWWALILIVPFVVLAMTRAATCPDEPTGPGWLWIRVLFWSMLATDALGIVLGVSPVTECFVTIWILAMEYCLTLKTLPPRPTRQRNFKGKTSHV